MFVFHFKEMKIIQKVKFAIIFIALNNVNKFFTARYSHFSPFGIIEIIIWFS